MVTFNKIIEFYLYTNCSNYTNFTKVIILHV